MERMEEIKRQWANVKARKQQLRQQQEERAAAALQQVQTLPQQQPGPAIQQIQAPPQQQPGPAIQQTQAPPQQQPGPAIQQTQPSPQQHGPVVQQTQAPPQPQSRHLPGLRKLPPPHQQEASAIQQIRPSPQQHIPAIQQIQAPLQQPAIQQTQSLSAPQQQRQTVYTVNGKLYTRGKVLGTGGSCKVYEAHHNGNVYAIKVVDLDDLDQRVVDGYLAEVELLERLQGKEGIIQLENWQKKEYEDGHKELLVVMEKGDNNFQTFLRSTNKSPNLIRYYWESMLQCVQVIHGENIIHSDLKPANFIFVNNKLKLIDFGIASSIPTDLTSIPKEAQAGTLNYMSPESIQCRNGDDNIRITLATDIWSLGCILYSMVYDVLPWGHITSQIAKMNAISNKDVHFKPIEDEQLLNVMQECLQRNGRKRPTVTQLLEHPYLKPNNTNVSLSNTNSGISYFTSSKTINEDSEMIGRILEEARNNTPRTAAKKVYSILNEQPVDLS
uniref:Protein kinase domain-containing protein n=1 Tax=Panagrolaimus davidi TaxID=227884 RepID=A0A914QT39_9BILA